MPEDASSPPEAVFASLLFVHSPRTNRVSRDSDNKQNKQPWLVGSSLEGSTRWLCRGQILFCPHPKEVLRVLHTGPWSCRQSCVQLGCFITSSWDASGSPKPGKIHQGTLLTLLWEIIEHQLLFAIGISKDHNFIKERK